MTRTSEKFGHSSDTTRKIDSLRRMADRLMRGETLRDPSYLHHIADEMERVYGIMLQRFDMGTHGTDTGLRDRHGFVVCIGDTVEFDPQEWGGECRFTVTYDRATGSLRIPGTASDAERWWTVLGPDGAPLHRTIEEVTDREKE